MKIRATDEVAAAVRERGGRLYVWTSAHRCCTGPLVLLETGSEPPNGEARAVPRPRCRRLRGALRPGRAAPARRARARAPRPAPQGRRVLGRPGLGGLRRRRRAPRSGSPPGPVSRALHADVRRVRLCSGVRLRAAGRYRHPGGAPGQAVCQARPRRPTLPARAYCAVIAPSATSTVPVTNDDSSEARKSAQLAISTGSPGRPIGWNESMVSYTCCSPPSISACA